MTTVKANSDHYSLAIWNGEKRTKIRTAPHCPIDSKELGKGVTVRFARATGEAKSLGFTSQSFCESHSLGEIVSALDGIEPKPKAEPAKTLTTGDMVSTGLLVNVVKQHDLATQAKIKAAISLLREDLEAQIRNAVAAAAAKGCKCKTDHKTTAPVTATVEESVSANPTAVCGVHKATLAKRVGLTRETMGQLVTHPIAATACQIDGCSKTTKTAYTAPTGEVVAQDTAEDDEPSDADLQKIESVEDQATNLLADALNVTPGGV